MARGSKKSKSPGSQRVPRVFVSSTGIDLKDCRDAAKEAVLHARLHPEMHDYWEARDHRPYAECMERVEQCEVLIVIVAKRYGWEPEDQPAAADGERKSITWLECEKAKEMGIEVIPFLLDEQAAWDEKFDEVRTLQIDAFRHPVGTAEFLDLSERAQRLARRLAAFREWLVDGRQRKLFTDCQSLGREIILALNAWKSRKPPTANQARRRAPALTTVGANYREWLRRECGSVELLGLNSKTARAPSIGSVYVPAVTRARAIEPGTSEEFEVAAAARGRPDRPDHELLLHRLATESLYVEGNAGSGKSTFCKWVAWLLANGSMPPVAAEAPDRYREHFPEALASHTPVRIVLRDAWEHFCGAPGARSWSQRQFEDALAKWADSTNDGAESLGGAALRTLLAEGQAVLIFDGVDEVPSSHDRGQGNAYPRDTLLRGLVNAQNTWQKRGNRVLVTSRPDVVTPDTLHALGLTSAPLAAMPNKLQELFVARWFAATDPDKGANRATSMRRDLASRPELLELAGNPILLTALCICYSDGERLPEDQFLLYDRVVNGVLAHRYRDESKEALPARRRLAAIALGMHTGSDAPQLRATPSAEVTHAELEGVLATYSGANLATEGDQTDVAQKLADLLAKSGLLVDRPGRKASFYHLSFQEFLAAEHITQTRRSDPDLLTQFRTRGATSEWRRTLVQLFGALAFRYRDPTWAVERLTELAREQGRDRLIQHPQFAVMLADCVDIACAKGWRLGELRDEFTKLCLLSIEAQIDVPARARLALTLGRLGDPRPGVGVQVDGVPDIEWVAIPAGDVRMDTKLVHVGSFSIARYPITHAQFAAFLNARDGYCQDQWWDGLERSEPWISPWTEPNAPRVVVSWFEAVAFCRWLSDRTGRKVRLPKEAEWQLAATGGDPSREFPWGDRQDGRCNSRESEIGRTSVVGIFDNAPRPGGPLDMAGNVWQWCGGFITSWLRVLRGGSWRVVAGWCGSASRDGWHAGFRGDSVGFRPASSSPN
ncbi:MAG: SUMF1/EgtB/PvdO family nonheme iron enzyme [Planctomycetota bacterium]